MDQTRKSSPMRSLERAVDVLEVLEASRVPLRLSEVARRAGLHIATTQRILAALQARGRVEHSDAGFNTGVAMLFGAHAYLGTSRIPLAAPLVLQQLATSTRLTASVFVRFGCSRAVVNRVEGIDPLRYVLPVGERLPLHLGAGKVLAAHMPFDEVSACIGGHGFSRADGTTVSLEDFRVELEEIRRVGVATARDERVVGASSVAAPVLNSAGACIAAVQIAGSSHSPIFEDQALLVHETMQAASALARRLG